MQIVLSKELLALCEQFTLEIKIEKPQVLEKRLDQKKN
jgi:hypothetical protein